MDFSFEKVSSTCGQLLLLVSWTYQLLRLHLQTHSAYMLFYKRVELEEENGKDFSFDVSPDLLEVLSSFLFLKIQAIKTSSPASEIFLSVFCFSVDLAWQHAVSAGQKHFWAHLLWVSLRFFRRLVPAGDRRSRGLCLSAGLCGSCAAVSPALCRTPKPSPSWPQRWESAKQQPHNKEISGI